MAIGVATPVLYTITSFYGLSLLPACFLCCISPLLLDESHIMGMAPGMGAPHYGEEVDFDPMGERVLFDHMLVMGCILCLWLYPMNVVFSVGFMWACHAVWLCDVLWLPERALILMPFLHIVLFILICGAMAVAYRERSKRRFQAACDRAKLFQDDPQAFFREKKFRAGGGAAAPRAAPSFPDV